MSVWEKWAFIIRYIMIILWVSVIQLYNIKTFSGLKMLKKYIYVLLHVWMFLSLQCFSWNLNTSELQLHRIGWFQMSFLYSSRLCNTHHSGCGLWSFVLSRKLMWSGNRFTHDNIKITPHFFTLLNQKINAITVLIHMNQRCKLSIIINDVWTL